MFPDLVVWTKAKKMNKFILVLFILIFSLRDRNERLACVVLSTEMGKIVLSVDTINAPLTGKNFLNHVENGTFQTAVFYRVVRMDNQPQNDLKIEVIQGGLYADEEIEMHSPIGHENTKETGLKHLNGTISMARMEPGTASTEFFICIGNQPELDFGGTRNPDGQGFAAFGKVVEGMDAVKKIQQLPDENQYLAEPVKIISASIISNKKLK